MIAPSLSTIGLAEAAATAGCIGSRVCTDDSGPNLVVRGVEFLLVLALVGTVVWGVKRSRRRLRRNGGDHDEDETPRSGNE